MLLVQEVEIRDRMATSEINKFLYQYSSSARPKQSNAYMVKVFVVCFLLYIVKDLLYQFFDLGHDQSHKYSTRTEY